MNDPSLNPIQKDNKKKPKNKSKQPQLLRDPETSKLHMRRNSEKNTERNREGERERREDEPSICPGSVPTLVSHRIHLCSLVGAKYNSMGLLTFQYFSLTSSREKEPFRT